MKRSRSGSSSRYLMVSPKIAISRYSSNGCQAHTQGPVWGGCWDASPLQPLVGQIISKSIYLFTLKVLFFFPTFGKTLTLRSTSARCYILQEFISYLSQMGSVVFKLLTLSKYYIGYVIIQNLHVLKEKQVSSQFLSLAVN